MRNYGSIAKALNMHFDQEAAAIVVAPGLSGSLASYRLRRIRRPYGVEVIGDPHEVYGPGSVQNPLRPVLRVLTSELLRSQCRHAAAVAYVNKRTLPERYPTNECAFVTNYSSIDLQNEHLKSAPQVYKATEDYIRIATVGSLAQPYKGVDVLLQSLAELRGSIPAFTLTVVGEGSYRSDLQRQSVDLGLANQVDFLGHIQAGDAIREVLDSNQLFVLASRTEGLPRAMIEAMARGLPCIGTTVGGIPELLPTEDMVPPNAPEALANKIIEIVHDPERMSRMSARNLDKAKEYRSDVLQARRAAMYMHLKDVTKAWQDVQKR